MFLMQIEDLWADIENLSQKCNLSPKESVLKYSEFLEHFKLGTIQEAVLDPDSLFVKMLELEGVFIKPEDMFSMDISTLSGEKTYTVSPDAGFDLFKFKILALLVCRGSPKVKAGLLFDLVYRGKEIPEKVIIWSNSKLKSAFEQLVFFSEIMPKLFYLRSQNEKVIKEKIEVELGKIGRRNYQSRSGEYRSPVKQTKFDVNSKKTENCEKDDMEKWTQEYVDKTVKDLE